MANHDSPIVTNLEATPNVAAPAAELYGKQRTLVETFEIEAADNNGDTFTLYPVSLSARIDDVEYCNDSVTGGTDYDLGFYKITDGDLGAAIDADILVDGQSLATTRSIWTSVLFLGTNAKDQGSVGNKVWEDCGYASLEAAYDANPSGMVYVVLTANTAGTAAGTISVKTTITVE